MVLILKHVRTQEELYTFAHEVLYVGATIDPERRRGEHERERYNGKMYCAPTQNMELAENKLLEVCPCYANRQRRSNASPAPGYVYIIVNILILHNVTQTELWCVAPQGEYAGITKDPERRRGEHQGEGYKGIMYCAPTQNMELAENKLLEVCPCYANRQRRSNASPDPGYVYIIV